MTCQLESHFGKHCPIYHTVLPDFIHLLLYKDENEYMKGSTLWKKRVVLTTLVHFKERYDVIRCDKHNDVMPQLNLLAELKPIKRKIKH